MRRRRLGVAVGAVAMALLLVAGCGSGDDETGASDQSDQSDNDQVGREIGEAIGSQTTPPTTAAPATTAAPPPVPISDLAIGSVGVPSAAGAGNDACQERTTFGAENLNDGYSSTAWRTSGDISGQELTVTLDGQHDVRSVGLIPGYAKVDQCDGTDRFAQNRRVLRATWTFDDGSSVSQDFAETPELQSISVATVTTTIRLRIEAVSAPGGKDFTAISEISVRGS